MKQTHKMKESNDVKMRLLAEEKTIITGIKRKKRKKSHDILKILQLFL